MKESTVIACMRTAFRQYRIDQPDDYSFAIYGPDDFYELHESYSAAFERREELALLAALKAMKLPPKARFDVGGATLDSRRAERIVQALVDAIADEYEAGCENEASAMAN